MLWRLHLDHPNFRYLKLLFPKLFYNKDLICHCLKVNHVNLQNIVVLIFH